MDASGDISYDARYELRMGGQEAVTLDEVTLEEKVREEVTEGKEDPTLDSHKQEEKDGNGGLSDNSLWDNNNSLSDNSLSGNTLSGRLLETIKEQEKEEGICYITICLEESWLLQAKYPVVVDPVLKQNRAKNLKDSGGLCSTGTVTETLYVGKNSTGTYRSFLKFDLPRIPSQAIVSEAMLYLAGTRVQGDTHYLTVSMVNEPWHHRGGEQEGKKLGSWEQQPAAGKVLDYHVNGGSFNITKALRRWLSGEQENHGLVFRAYNEDRAKRATLKLKNSKTSPYLKVTYRTAVGLEGYYGYHTTGAGTAGTGYIQNHTGALTQINGALATAGNRFPMTITRSYNSNDTAEKGGWRFNYEQTLKVPLDQTDITTYPYVLTDGDGTRHYFKKSDVTYLENGTQKTAKADAALPSARDEDGLKLYVVPVTDGVLKETYPLKVIDKSGSLVRYFDKMGRLGMVTDGNQYENGKNSATKERNALTITLEEGGVEASLENFEAAITAASAFRELCQVKTTTTTGSDYLGLLEQLEGEVEELKEDAYATSDYKTAKQVREAAKKLADLTDTENTVTRSTALNRGEAILTALNKAKTQAQPLIKESGKRIASVTDGVGNKALFRYDERGNVAAISDPSYEEFREILYTYDGEGNLREITFADGRKAWYTYGKNHRLETAQDNDGYKVTYTYRQEDGRILKVEECHTATPEKKEIPFTPGQTYAITYGTDGTTTFRFSGVDDIYGNGDDIENVHVFDEQGRSVCVYSKRVGEPGVIGAVAATYEAETDSDGSENLNKRNKLKDTAQVGMHANNLLCNHSFEYSDDHWTAYKNEGEKPESGALAKSSTSRRYLGEKAAYINLAKRKGGVAGFYQQVSLTGGTYTFSGYCKAVNPENASACLKVRDSLGNTFYSHKIREETALEFDNGWQRLSVTFTLPEGTHEVTVFLETDCGQKAGKGNVAFDCVQLEEGPVANDYNILEDGSFELAATGEVLPYKAKNYSAKAVEVEDERSGDSMDGSYSYHISGQPGRDKFLRLYADLGSAKNSFVLSGWVKTESTPAREGRDLKVVAYHKEETPEAIITLTVSTAINAYSEGWKYFTLILPAASWKKTSLTFRFYDNIGDLYIDGLQLTRNDVQTRKYDSQGRVVSRYTSLMGSTSTHDSYHRLKTATDPAGATSTYTYAKSGDVTRIAMDVGPDTYYTYDKYGNRLTTAVYNPEAATRLETYTETSYTADGNFTKDSTDSSGNVTAYRYNSFTGQLEKTLLPARSPADTPVEVDYLYDEKDRILGVTQADREIRYSYGEFDDLRALHHNGFSYEYEYDAFGNVTRILLAGQEICRNEYNPNNGSHVRSLYPDGTATGKTYDEYGRVTSNSLDGRVITKYLYDKEGNVAEKKDLLGEITTAYHYNDSNMTVRSEVYGGAAAGGTPESRMQYIYTKSGQVGTLSYQEGEGDIRTYTYTFRPSGAKGVGDTHR